MTLIDELAERYPSLSVCRADIECAANSLVVAYENGGKLLVAGNGERAAYKCDCNCRKPKTGMLLQMAKDFNIDLTQSYRIGDSQRDMDAGKSACCKASFLVSDSTPLAVVVDKIL